MAGTTITIDYARPRLRGRSPIFGGLVRWGEPATGTTAVMQWADRAVRLAITVAPRAP